MKHPLDAEEWLDRDGQPISCTSKLRVLRENEAELKQVLRDACDDALLMDVGPEGLRRRMERLLMDVMVEVGITDAGNGRADGKGNVA